jgi:hypothetical protein
LLAASIPEVDEFFFGHGSPLFRASLTPSVLKGVAGKLGL